MAQSNWALVAYMTLNDLIVVWIMMNYDEFLWCFFLHQAAIGWLLYHQNHPERSKCLTICQLTNPTVINYNIVKTSAIFNKKNHNKTKLFLIFMPQNSFFHYEKKRKQKTRTFPVQTKQYWKANERKVHT